MPKCVKCGKRILSKKFCKPCFKKMRSKAMKQRWQARGSRNGTARQRRDMIGTNTAHTLKANRRNTERLGRKRTSSEGRLTTEYSIGATLP